MKSIRKISILAAVLCSLASMAIPTHAAEPEPPADSFGISFTLKFFDKGEIDNTIPLEAYQENAFLLTDPAGWYLQAEYNAADSAYHPTGWTLEEAAATRLRCGQSLEEPGYVAVMGLPGGTYHLTQLETADEYDLINDPMEISLSIAYAEVNGQPVQKGFLNGIVHFSVISSKLFPLPKLYGSTWQMIRESRSMRLIVLAGASFAISVVFLITLWSKSGKQSKNKSLRTHNPSSK